MESKIEKKEDINESKLLILYDELQFSYDTAKQKLESIFKAIESNNNKNDKNSKNFYFNEKNSTIKLENKYYICDIKFEIYSFNNIDKLDLSVYEGILLFFEETSIKNKIFADKSHHFDEKYNFSTCIIIFEEEQEDLQNLELFDDFIGQTIDKHFEVIYDCQNLKNFNTDDGIGAFNLSLHSTQWKASKDNKEEKKDIKEKKDEKTEKKEEKMEKKEGNKFYKELNDTEEIEKIFGKIKEIKELNKDPKISMEERRNNAEKAIMMLADMFHLDDDDDEEKEDDEDKK
jgi:hypothetical protein